MCDGAAFHPLRASCSSPWVIFVINTCLECLHICIKEDIFIAHKEESQKASITATMTTFLKCFCHSFYCQEARHAEIHSVHELKFQTQFDEASKAFNHYQQIVDDGEIYLGWQNRSSTDI